MTNRKRCIKCNDPIRDPQLPGEEERCAQCCDDASDPLDCIKQEAFVEGWQAKEENEL